MIQEYNGNGATHVYQVDYASPWRVNSSKLLAVGIIAALGFAFLLPMSGHAVAATGASITISPSAAIVGTTLSISGQGYSPNTQLSLEWSTAIASWVVTGNPPRVTGVNATPVENTFASVETDSSGSFSANFTVPSDYGGQHVIQALFANGTAIIGRGLFNLEPSFTISPSKRACRDAYRGNCEGTGLRTLLDELLPILG